jgi:5-methyltetrahydrofolate--homocysteine methyltransferase
LEIRKRFLDVLRDKILVLDGAMGTMLESVLLPGEPPEIINLRSPDIVGGLHAQYVDAGADIVETNTFGGNRLKLSKHGLEERIAEVNRNAVGIAKEYCPSAYVWASMGPTGELLEPYGTMTFQDCYRVFAEQARYFEQAGADAVSIETMADLHEMKAAVLAIKDTTSLPVVAHMTFVDNERTLMGNDIESVAVVLEALGVDLIGANCSLGPSELLNVVRRLSAATSLPLSVEPNAGMPMVKNGKTVFPLTPQDMGIFVEEFIRLGVCVIGGCCGTNPEHIKEIRRRSRNLKPVIRESQNVLKLSTGRKSELLSDTEQHVVVSDMLVCGDADMAELEVWARQQQDIGAQVMRFSKGCMATEEFMEVVKNLQLYTSVSLGIEYFQGIGSILENVRGKPWVCVQDASNSLLGEALSLANRYGAGAIVSTSYGNMHPLDAEHVVAGVSGILECVKECSFPPHSLVIDIQVEDSEPIEVSDLELAKAFGLVWKEFHVRTALLV